MGKKLPVLTVLPASYEGIVSRYIVEKRPGAQKEREFYAQQMPGCPALPSGSMCSVFRVKDAVTPIWWLGLTPRASASISQKLMILRRALRWSSRTGAEVPVDLRG